MGPLRATILAMGLIGLALVTDAPMAQTAPVHVVPAPSAARAPGETPSHMGESDLLRRMGDVCALSEAQRREIARIVRGSGDSFARVESGLAGRIESVRSALEGTHDPEQRARLVGSIDAMESVRGRASRVVRARVLDLLTPTQRAAWNGAQLVPLIMEEFAVVRFTRSQVALVGRVCELAGYRTESPDVAGEREFVLDVMREVYLKVLGRNQRIRYAQAVRHRSARPGQPPRGRQVVR